MIHLMKAPTLWTEDEIHDLVMTAVGVDETFPRGYQVLVLVWSPPKDLGCGFERSDHEIQNKTGTSSVGLVLRMGQDAFNDKTLFPSGPIITYGEWAIFRGMERQKVMKRDKELAFVNDDRFIGVEKDPATLKTHFDISYEFAGQ